MIKKKEEKEQKNLTKKQVKIYENFDEMELDENLLKGIYSHGFENPSKIQQRAIIPIIEGHDIIAQSQSGTGKTGAFIIGILQRIKIEELETQGLILAPTRELANQIFTVCKSLSQYINNIKIRLCIGGIRNRNNRKNEHHLIIGTPGRVLQNIQNKNISTKKLKIFCMDEADEMLSRGFVEQIKNIFMEINKETQIVLFSATMPKDIIDLCNKEIMNEPVHILTKRQHITLDGINQYFVDVGKNSYKLITLMDLLNSIPYSQCIIFISRVDDVYFIKNKLKKENFCVSFITGKMDQKDRNDTIRDFRAEKTRILLTTGLLNRGFDSQKISLVINYDMPKDKENYIHCCGRTGRYGRKGTIINFISKKDDYIYKENIERFYNTIIEVLPEDFSNL